MLYPKKPSGFDPKFEVVSCYVEHDGTFLLLRRHDGKSQGGKWGIVAGKVNTGETAQDAMLRELREESGIAAAPADLNYFGQLCVNHGADFIYHMFSLRLEARPSIQLSLDEHREFAWVTPQQAAAMNLVDDLAACNRLFFGNTL